MTTAITVSPETAATATAVDAPKSPAELGQFIENAFGNPLQIVRLAASSSARGGLQQHELRRYSVDFRTQLHGALESAWYQLNVLLAYQRSRGKDSYCASERARARAIIFNIGDWLTRSWVPFLGQQDPDGYDPLFTVRVPPHVLEWLGELDVLGRVLRMTVTEIGAKETVGPFITLEGACALISQAGTPRPKTTEWVSIRDTAELTRLASETLKNRRYAGMKSEDGLYGVDTDGRIWAKARPNAQSCYLRAFLQGKPSL